jgi:hypothetical protein
MSMVRAGPRIGDALLAGAATGHGQPAADPAGDRVLGQRRAGELARFLQAGLPVRHPQPARRGQVLRRVAAQDLQGAFHPRARRHRSPGAAPQVRVIEVGQPVGGGPDLTAHPPFLPGQQGRCALDRRTRCHLGSRGVLATVLPQHLAGAFIFGGVGVFLLLILPGAATGVRASRSVP